MAGIVLQDQPIASIQRLLDLTKHAGLIQLEAVLACTFTFNNGYFDQILDALAECRPDGSDHLQSIAIDVVCDHRHYNAHSPGYNVSCWKGSALFHPKLLLLLFADRIAWIEGSLNITRSGYTVNRELATFHQTARRALPQGVFELVKQLAGQGVEAAKLVFDATSGLLQTDASNRSVTSLDSTLLNGFIKRSKNASDVYVVSPYFDRRDQAGPSIDTTALRVLSKQYPKARFHIFLPEVTGEDGKLALQGSKGLFAQVFGPKANKNRVHFCGVPSDERPLHAKLLAIRHGERGATVNALTGSPNLTEIALLRQGTHANVELAREVRLRWKDLEQLLRPLGRKFKALSDCRFEPPQPMSPMGWNVLRSAIYHPFRRELVLEWKQPDDAGSTRLYYAGALLDRPDESVLRDFGICNDELRLETVSQADPSRRSWYPIIIPYEARLALAEMPEQDPPSPEWWLAQLGALAMTQTTSGRSNGQDISAASSDAMKFPLGVRVRDLADRMGYAIGAIEDNSKVGAPRASAHLDLLEKIFEVHDQGTITDPAEQTWRTWVRLEIVQALNSVAPVRGEDGRKRHALKVALTHQLSTAEVPHVLQHQWRILTDALI